MSSLHILAGAGLGLLGLARYLGRRQQDANPRNETGESRARKEQKHGPGEGRRRGNDVDDAVDATLVIGGAVIGGMGLIKALKNRNSAEEDNSDDNGPILEGVTQEDLKVAQNQLDSNCQSPIVCQDAGPRKVHLGVYCNNWRRPVAQFGYGEGKFYEMLKEHEDIGAFNIKGSDWRRSELYVHQVLSLLFKEIRAIASRRSYNRLVIQKYVNQGSSREGLKVREANEFDTVLQFEFQGLKFEVEEIEGLPELGLLRVLNIGETIEKTFPKLFSKGVFVNIDGRWYLSSKGIHEKVFESLLDTAAVNVQRKINDSNVKLTYRITRSMNPPSVNITIFITEKAEAVELSQHVQDRATRNAASFVEYKIDVDIVPGILVAMDDVPDPYRPGYSMKCPKYAVFKWLQGSQSFASEFSYPHLVWRICTSGYEKHILDVCQLHVDQKYIVTADRIMKTYFSKAKEEGRSSPRAPAPQIVTVLRSYHLKMVSFYCILYLTILNKANLSGVREALAYFLAFLETCLDEECLPNFFYGNENIRRMFPNYKTGHLKVNMFKRCSGESLNQVRRSFRAMKQKLFKLGLPEIEEEYVEQFIDFVRSGDYA